MRRRLVVGAAAAAMAAATLQCAGWGSRGAVTTFAAASDGSQRSGLAAAIDAAWQESASLQAPAGKPGYKPAWRRRNKRPSRSLFEKFPKNPVLELSEPPAFDSGHVEYPSVIAVADSLWMFHAVFGAAGRWSIAAATSRNGIDWQKHGEVLLPDTTAGAWDSSTIAFPCAVYEADAAPERRFRLYYAGKSDDFYRGIGFATSPDGLTWTRRGRVLAVGGPGDFDRGQIVDPAVLRVDDGYRMYYCGSPSRTGMFMVGVALSADGEQWVKYPDNPVYALDAESAPGVYTVEVTLLGGRYVLFESSPDPEGFFDVFGVASGDGFRFDSEARRRVLLASHDRTWDHVMVYGMDATAAGDRVYLWYNGIHRKMVTRGGQIGLARASTSALLAHLTDSGS